MRKPFHRSRRLLGLTRSAWDAARVDQAAASPRLARLFPAPVAVIVLLGVIVAVAVAAGVARLSTPTPSAASTPTATHSSTPAPDDSGPDITGSKESASASAGSTVVVHVVGHVGRPGLVTLRAGARVADALDAAGGPSADADLTDINLARPVEDGEQVHVFAQGEAPADAAGAAASGAGTGAGQSGTASASGSGGGGGSGGVVNINSASAADLEALPGIGPSLAQRIIDSRQQDGRFSSVDDLQRVSGIGTKTLDKLRSRVRV